MGSGRDDRTWRMSSVGRDISVVVAGGESRGGCLKEEVPDCAAAVVSGSVSMCISTSMICNFCGLLVCTQARDRSFEREFSLGYENKWFRRE